MNAYSIAPTIVMQSRFVQGNSRQFSGVSPLVRYALLREVAAQQVRRWFPKHLKKFEGLSAHKISAMRNDGGAAGDIAVLMFANPDKASDIAEFFSGIAQTINETRALCLESTHKAEQEADCAEDLAQMDVLQNPNDPEALKRYIERIDDYAARLRETRAAAVQKLNDLEAK